MKQLVIAAVACCGLVVSGCSDDKDSSAADGPSESGGTTLTKEQVIEQGDAICTESNTRIDAADDNFIDPANPTEAEYRVAVLDVVVPEIRDQVADLRALEAPADDAEEIDAMLAAVEAGVAELEADPLALIQADPFADANALAQEYGFAVCGAS